MKIHGVEILEKAVIEINNLVDEDSELRYFNKAKKWQILVDKDCIDVGYLIVSVQNRYIEIHKRNRKDGRYFTTSLGRVILGIIDKTKVCEHINGNPLDNRRINLRVCDQGKNTKNRKPYSLKTGYKGLSIGNNMKSLAVEIQNDFIRSRVSFNQVVIEKLGAVIYDCLAIKFHKEYSRLNFEKEEYEKPALEFILNLIADDITQSYHN